MMRHIKYQSISVLKFTKVNRLPSESLLYKSCDYLFNISECNFAITYLYKEKYQGCRPCSFRQEYFFMFAI